MNKLVRIKENGLEKFVIISQLDGIEKTEACKIYIEKKKDKINNWIQLPNNHISGRKYVSLSKFNEKAENDILIIDDDHRDKKHGSYNKDWEIYLTDEERVQYNNSLEAIKTEEEKIQTIKDNCIIRLKDFKEKSKKMKLVKVQDIDLETVQTKEEIEELIRKSQERLKQLEEKKRIEESSKVSKILK